MSSERRSTVTSPVGSRDHGGFLFGPRVRFRLALSSTPSILAQGSGRRGRAALTRLSQWQLHVVARLLRRPQRGRP